MKREQVEKVIQDALDSNGYDGTVPSNEMATIILYELENEVGFSVPGGLVDSFPDVPLLVDQFFLHDQYGLSYNEIMKEALASAKRRGEFERYTVHSVKIVGKVDRQDRINNSTLSTHTIHVYGVKND